MDTVHNSSQSQSIYSIRDSELASSEASSATGLGGRPLSRADPLHVSRSMVEDPSLSRIRPAPHTGMAFNRGQVVRHAPPANLDVLARHASLPDRATMIARCGRPKDDRLFGLIKMSTNYKAILRELDHVQKVIQEQNHEEITDQKIEKFSKTLGQLKSAVNTYIAGSDKQRFKAQMRQLQIQIDYQIHLLAGVKEQLKGNEWPPGYTLKDALDHKDRQVQNLIQDQILYQYRQGQILRANLRQLDKLDDQHVHKLLNQAEFAVKTYVNMFLLSGKVPAELQHLSRAQLEDRLEELPFAKLDPENRPLAARLLETLHENTTLIHQKYQDFDERFAMPEYATEGFGHAQGRQTATSPKTLTEHRRTAEHFVNQLMEKLIPETRLQSLNQETTSPKERERALVAHFDGLLRDRLDARIAFGLLDNTQTQFAITDFLAPLKLSRAEKDHLSKTLSNIVQQHQPQSGKNLILGRLLGEGSFGKVFEGTFQDKPVVVKNIALSSRNRYGELIIESLRQAELRESPHAPKLIGFTAIDGKNAQIVMEKIGGGDYKQLEKEIHKGTEALPKPEQMTRRAQFGIHCIAGMTKGLEPMHQRNLVHCDLKPANVMFDDKMLEPRLIDFGLAAKKGDTFFGGTPITISPEVADKKAPEPASDVYALGCILYEQITGQIASVFDRRSRSVIKETNFNARAWKATPLNECRDFIQACMKENPSQRPTTAQILQAIRGEVITPASGTDANPGLKANELKALRLFEPEKGHIAAGQEILARYVNQESIAT